MKEQSEKAKRKLEMQKTGEDKIKKVKPIHLLPILHNKTHFKAAMEYSMNDTLTQRTLRDDNRNIERMLQDAHAKMVKDLPDQPSVDTSKIKENTFYSRAKYTASSNRKHYRDLMDTSVNSNQFMASGRSFYENQRYTNKFGTIANTSRERKDVPAISINRKKVGFGAGVSDEDDTMNNTKMSKFNTLEGFGRKQTGSNFFPGGANDTFYSVDERPRVVTETFDPINMARKMLHDCQLYRKREATVQPTRPGMDSDR